MLKPLQVVTGDGELIVSGLKKTAINAVTTVIQFAKGDGDEAVSNDDDETD